MDERKSVKGTNAARDKLMSTDSSTRLEHAAWQDGGVVLLSHPSRMQPRHVQSPRGRRPKMKNLWNAPAGFSQGPAYKSGPGLFTRQGQIEVLGSAGGSTGLQDIVEP